MTSTKIFSILDSVISFLQSMNDLTENRKTFPSIFFFFQKKNCVQFRKIDKLNLNYKKIYINYEN